MQTGIKKFFDKFRLRMAAIIMGINKTVSTVFDQVDFILKLRKVVENPALNLAVDIVTALTINIPDEMVWDYFKKAIIVISNRYEFLNHLKNCIENNPDNPEKQVQCLVNIIRESDEDVRGILCRDLAKIMTLIREGRGGIDYKEKGQLNEAIEMVLNTLKKYKSK